MANEFIDKETALKREQEKEKKQKKKKATKEKTVNSKTFKQILNGDFLSKEFFLNNMTYLFFVMLLLIVLVSKGYFVNQQNKDIEKTQKELKQLTSDYAEANAQLEERTNREKLVEKLTPRGVKETIKPTKVIRVKKNEE